MKSTILRLDFDYFLKQLMATSNAWDSYIWQVQNKWSVKNNNYSITNVCAHAAIYGIDGSPWATSAEWPGLHEYEHPLEQDDGSTTNIKVNEFNCAMAVSNGKRMPTAAGVRLGHTKFVMIKHDPETNVCYLSRMGGGGACVARTKNALVIGIWDKNMIMSNNQP
jgi:hypothetical protein